MSFNIENLIGMATVLEDDGLSYIWTYIPKSMHGYLEEKESYLEMVGDLTSLITQGFQDLGFPLISSRFKVLEIATNNKEQIIPQTILFITNENYPLTFIIISSKVVPLDIIIKISNEMGMVLEDFMKIYKKFLIIEDNNFGIRNFLNKNNGINYFPYYIDYKINTSSQNMIDNFFNFSITPKWLNFKREEFTNLNDINENQELISIIFEKSENHLDEQIKFDELFFQYLSSLSKSIYEGMINLGELTKRNYANLMPLIDFCVFKSGFNSDTYVFFQGLYNNYRKDNKIILDSILFSGLNSKTPNFNNNVNLLKNKFNNLLLKTKVNDSNQISMMFEEFFNQNYPYMVKKFE
ncbi:MAG: hypothetical protein EAX96_13170 [Candidatus Lokiarchaeota archaeon]|nr:hypothetical protein [Candidatus Lokiarchaeota archaeon]